MNTLLVTLLAAFSLTAFLTYLFQLKGGLSVDIPNQRSSHLQPIPRGGGCCFFLVFSGAIFFLQQTGILSLSPEMASLFFVASMFGLIGAVDDAIGLSIQTKFISGIILAFIFSAAGMNWHEIDFGIFRLSLSWGIYSVITVFWITWVVNLYNMMDGINGISAFKAIVLSGFFAWVGYQWDLPELRITMSLLFATVLAFLPFNFPKAKIFMGDSGSLFLGAVFAMLPVYLNHHSQGKFTLWHAVLCLGPFFLDTTFTAIRRLFVLGTGFCRPHRNHYYQRLADILNSHIKPTLIYTGLSCLFILSVSLSLLGGNKIQPYFFILPLCSMGVLFFIISNSHFVASHKDDEQSHIPPFQG